MITIEEFKRLKPGTLLTIPEFIGPVMMKVSNKEVLIDQKTHRITFHTQDVFSTEPFAMVKACEIMNVVHPGSKRKIDWRLILDKVTLCEK